MLKGFLLNLDGTFLDSNEANVIAWAHALQHFGYDITRDEIRSLMGMGGDRVLPALVPGLSLDDGRGKEISEYRKEYFQKHLAQDIQPTSGGRDLLLELKKRHLDLVVSTSADKADVSTMLTKAKIDDLIDDVVTASDVKASKPSSDILEAALKKIGFSCDEVLMLGDSPFDIASAKKNGIKTIALRSGGFSDEQLKGAVAIFDNPKDFLENLDSVIGLPAEEQNIPQRTYLELEEK